MLGGHNMSSPQLVPAGSGNSEVTRVALLPHLGFCLATCRRTRYWSLLSPAHTQHFRLLSDFPLFLIALSTSLHRVL